MQYSALIQIKTNNMSGTVYIEPVGEQSTWGGQAFIWGDGGAKFEIKHKSRCLQKSKLVDWGPSTSIGGARTPRPLLAPALSLHLVVGLRNSKFSSAESCKS